MENKQAQVLITAAAIVILSPVILGGVGTIVSGVVYGANVVKNKIHAERMVKKGLWIKVDGKYYEILQPKD